MIRYFLLVCLHSQVHSCHRVGEARRPRYIPPLTEWLHFIWSYLKAWNSLEDQWSWGQRYQREGGQPSPGINSLPSPGLREVVCYNWAIFTLPKVLHIVLSWVMVPCWTYSIWGFIEGSALTCASLWGPAPYDNHSGEGDDGCGVEDQKGMGAIYPKLHLSHFCGWHYLDLLN